MDTIYSDLERARPGCTTGNPVNFPKISKDTQGDWLQMVHGDMRYSDRMLPKGLWAYAATMYLPEDIKAPMRELQKHKVRLPNGQEEEWDGYGLAWSWDQFKENLETILDSISLSKLGLIAAAVIGGAALGPSLIVGGLGVLGFQAGGVLAGSIAAGAQSAFYGGATSGLFALCQSIGATGAVGAAGTLGSALASGTAAAGYVGSKKDDNGDDESNHRADEDRSDGGDNDICGGYYNHRVETQDGSDDVRKRNSSTRG